MADKTITQLNNISGANLLSDDEFVVVDISADETKSITREEFFKNTPSIDVTGTLTGNGIVTTPTDGFKINSGTDIEASWTHVSNTGASTINVGRSAAWGGDLTIKTDTKSRALFNNNGDISFYEDTGTTAKLFWDASAASLGIGETGALGAPLNVKSTGKAAALFYGFSSITGVTSDSNGEIRVGQNDNFQGRISYDGQSVGQLNIENSYNNNVADILFKSKSQNRLLIEGTGDISFYEDTGAEVKLFWDASAESLGIGTDSPDAASILDVQSTTKGVRFPNMTTTQKNAMSNVAGNMVFDTTLGKMCFNTGTSWETITSAL